jgi:hypothetical protein
MGWRGPYLETPPRGDNILRDGWGNPFVFSVVDGNMTITSHGADGRPDGTGLSKDVSLVIRRTEYMAPVAGRVRSAGKVTIFFPIAGVESSRTITGLAAGAYFRFESTAPAPADIDIPVGLRSIARGTLLYINIFTVEPTGNWLGMLE